MSGRDGSDGADGSGGSDDVADAGGVPDVALDEALAAVTGEQPLINLVTSDVTANDVANATLYRGGLPVMPDDEREVGDMVSIADDCLFNTGTVSGLGEATMLTVGRAANDHGVPLVIDPVGVGAIPARDRVVDRLIIDLDVDVLNGNYGEISALADDDTGVRGVESVGEYAEIAAAAVECAQKTGTVVVASGETDIVAIEEAAFEVDVGHSMMGAVVGIGYILGAMLAVLGAVLDDSLLAALSGTAAYGLAGEFAAEDVFGDHHGPTSYETALLDVVVGPADASTPDIADRIDRIEVRQTTGIAPDPQTPPYALTTASSDPGGGVGIQADLKAMIRFGVCGGSAIVAATVQNTRGVEGSHVLPTESVRAQYEAIADDFDIAAVKLEMLATVEAVKTAADCLADYDGPVVLDSVMVATSGDRLLDGGAVDAYDALFAQATLVTPNADEAEALTGALPDLSVSASEAADRFLDRGADAVLSGGGYVAVDGDTAVDTLVTSTGTTTFINPRIDATATHGPGCTLPSAVTAHLARGDDLTDAVRHGTEFTRATFAEPADVGEGAGSMNHLVGAGDGWMPDES